MNEVVIFSGISGSGKTTAIEQLYGDIDDKIICSADHFFINDETGEYEFDPRKLAEAHQSCMSKYLRALASEKDKLIIVDNTNLTYSEREPYVQGAILAGVQVTINFLHVSNIEQLKLCIERNVHGVPKEVIFDMAYRHDFLVDRHHPNVSKTHLV